MEGFGAESEPSAKTLADIIDFIRENEITAVFYDELDSKSAIDAVSRETGAKTLVLSPYESLSESEAKNGDDYFSVMRRNLESIIEGCGVN